MDSRKPLTAGEIEELQRLHLAATQDMCDFPEREPDYYSYFCGMLFDALPRLLSLLTPPADAAVREAVEYLSSGWGESAESSRFKGHVETLIRAVQAISAKIAEYEAEIAEVKGLTRQCAAATVQDLDKADAAETFAGEVGRGE